MVDLSQLVGYGSCRRLEIGCSLITVLPLTASLLITSAAYAQATLSDPECQCRAPDGQMRDLGTVECVDIVGKKKLVSCVMSTNTPYWKTVEGVKGYHDA